MQAEEIQYKQQIEGKTSFLGNLGAKILNLVGKYFRSSNSQGTDIDSLGHGLRQRGIMPFVVDESVLPCEIQIGETIRVDTQREQARLLNELGYEEDSIYYDCRPAPGNAINVTLCQVTVFPDPYKAPAKSSSTTN